jgi:guanyl-specific ribonuclease Sa
MTFLRWLIVALVALPGLASAQGTVRVADYPSFGRVVFEFAVPTAFEVVEEGDRLLIVFDGAPSVGAAPRLPRNVRAIQGGAGSATIILAPGARFRSFRERSRVGIDVLDPTPNRGVRSSTRPGQGPVASTLPNPTVGPASSVKPDQAPVDIAAPLAVPVVPVKHDTLPNPALPEPPPVATPVLARLASVLLPFEPGVGAASFDRANAGVVVFDQRMPLDAALLRGTAFTDATVQLGQAVTVFAVPLEPNHALALLREPKGWRVTVTDNDTPAASLSVEPRPPGLLLKLDHPGQVVTIMDPSTGLALLVGTVNPAAGAGPALTPARRTPGYTLMPTWLGVAVEPLSDLVELRLATDGFVLSSPGIPSAENAPAPVSASFTRRFDLPDLPLPALLQRLKAQVAAAAAAPPRARTTDRMAAAQSLLSLGLATEAQAVLALIATEDPAAAADPNVTGLLAIAALLAGRSPEATGLDDPRLDGTDDVTLWRGLRDAMRDTDPEAGRGLARLLPLANAYPVALRDRLRPLVIEAAVASGQAASVAPALAKADDAALEFARALQSERDGDAPAALLAFDALAAGRDQLTQVRAGVRAAELRLRCGMLTATQAADALERYAAIWRGDARESRMRLRVAELRTAARTFRPALDTLRDTERLFPELQPAIRAAMAAVFQAMLAQPQAVPPLELITLASDYAALLPSNVGSDISALLADKLAALDLPNRAGPMLATLMAGAPFGPARAGIGARLAQMQLEDAAFAAVEATLNASDASELPAGLVEQRTLLRARAQAGRGDLANAVTGLAALGTASADDLRAKLLSQAADWKGSLIALSDLAAKVVSADGPLSEAMQDVVLRQATSAVQANDTALLADLRHRYGARLDGARADLFHLLAAEPLRSPSDLPRTATELALARLLPNRLQTLSAQNSR